MERRLREAVGRFVAAVPGSLEGFRSGAYSRLVDEFEVDNFGACGDRALLELLGIPEAPADFAEEGSGLAVAFQEEHAESWWRAESLLHQRVVSYADLLAELPAGRGPRSTMFSGCYFQQNGYQGRRPAEPWIVPTQLPVNHNVDRSLCSESQLLGRLCEELAGASGLPGGPESSRLLAWLGQVQGRLWLFVTGAPCLSCVGALRQFRLLLPGVGLRVSIGPELQRELVDG